MLEKIRQFANHYLFKIFFAIIAIVFVLSLRDFSKNSSNIVLEVKNQKVSIDEFNKAKQQIMNSYANQNLSAQQIDNLVLYNLTTKALLNQEVSGLGIELPSEIIADYVRNDKTFFKNDDFDFETYKKILSENNLSETMLVKTITNQVGSKFIADSVIANMPLTKVLNDYLFDYLTEKRETSLISIDTAGLNVANFNDKDLREFYEKNLGFFQSKEKRSYSYILISQEEMQKSIEYTEAELFKDYENNLSEYALPETRDFTHFLASSKEIAESLAKDLLTNSNTDEVAKSFIEKNVITETFTNQPSSSFVASIDHNLFEIKEGEISGPVKSDLGWHVFKVNKIHPRMYKSFAEARNEVEKKYRSRAAEQKIYELSKQLEDDLASGLNFKEIAERHKLPLSEVEDASGNDPITVIAFQTNLNEESNLIQIYNSQDYVIVRVNNITPSETLAYENVIDKVKDLYTMQLKTTIATDIAKALQETLQAENQKLISNSTLNSVEVTQKIKPICDKYNISPKNILISIKKLEVSRPTIVRNDELSPVFVDSIFNLKVGQATPAQTIDTTKVAFAILNKIIPNTNNDEQVFKYVQSIGEENYKNELFDQYIDYLKTKYEVKINYKLLQNSAD